MVDVKIGDHLDIHSMNLIVELSKGKYDTDHNCLFDINDNDSCVLKLNPESCIEVFTTFADAICLPDMESVIDRMMELAGL